MMTQYQNRTMEQCPLYLRGRNINLNHIVQGAIVLFDEQHKPPPSCYPSSNIAELCIAVQMKLDFADGNRNRSVYFNSETGVSR